MVIRREPELLSCVNHFQEQVLEQNNRQSLIIPLNEIILDKAFEIII
ncbi:hypothetical protein [Rummeliibacillus pycnus]